MTELMDSELETASGGMSAEECADLGYTDVTTRADVCGDFSAGSIATRQCQFCRNCVVSRKLFKDTRLFCKMGH